MSAERCIVRVQAGTSWTDLNTHPSSPSEFSFADPAKTICYSLNLNLSQSEHYALLSLIYDE